MTTQYTPDSAGGAPDPCPQPVDRARRARFIFGVVGFCLIMASLFTGIVAWVGVTAIYLPIVELFISGMMSLAMATTLAYVGGSVVDYSIGGMTRPSSTSKYVFPDTESKG